MLNCDSHNSVNKKLTYLKISLPKGKPIGLTFKTKAKRYFYDTVTGKILVCSDPEYAILEKVLYGNIDNSTF